MLSALHFIRPWCLLAFIPALALFITLLKRQREHGNWEKVCDAALLPYLLQHKTSKQSRIPLLTASLATTLLLLALAGPTWQRIPAPVFRNDSALVIALSLTETMNAADVTPSRLIRARYKISDLLKLRRDGQTALLVYSGDAFTVTPLTNDVDTIDSQLSALTTDIMPSPGNHTAVALQKAVELMKQAGQPNGQILLIADAVDLKASLPVAKDLSGYRLSILAVGTADGAPIKAAGGDFVKDDQGNIIIPKLRAADLQQLTQVGHGIFQTLRDDNQDIEVLAKQFNQAQEEGNTDNKLLLEQWEDKGPWLLLAALPFAALSFRKGLLSIALVALLPWPKTSQALEWRDLWLTKDQQAQQAFKQQDYDKAAEHFANPAWRAAAHYKAGKFSEAASDLQQAQDADSLYNQGNALAQSGALPEALKAYEQALKLKPNDADTLYNKDLVEKALKKQQQQQKQDSSKQNPSEKQDQQQQQEQQASGNDNAKDQASESKDASKDESKQEAKNPQQQDAEAKPDNSDSAAQQQAEQKAKEEQAKQEAMQQHAAEQTDAKKAEEKPQDAEPAATASKPLTETQQANEQWLKRIPDDPAGLLKRKFKYQYGQRNATNSGNPANW